MTAVVADNARAGLQLRSGWIGLWLFGCLLLLLLSLLPLPPLPLTVNHLDKIEHALAYAVLAGFAGLLFAQAPGRWIALAGLLGLGLLVEALQALLPWRSAEWQDLLANLSGLLLGQLVRITPLDRALLGLDHRLAALLRR